MYIFVSLHVCSQFEYVTYIGIKVVKYIGIKMFDEYDELNNLFFSTQEKYIYIYIYELIYNMFVLIVLTALLIAFWLLYNYLIKAKVLLCCFYQDYVRIVD